MGSGFSNPIIGGGGGLVYPSIHSPNFVDGVSGWSINKDGSAEFNNVKIIGGAVFTYSPSAGADNLISSVGVKAAGTDKYGNNYLAGDTSYAFFAGVFFAASLSSAGVQWYIGGAHQSAAYFQSVSVGQGVVAAGQAALVRLGASLALADPGIGGQFRGVWLAPSGDATGATDTANINDALGLIGGPSANKLLHLLPGTFYVNAPITVPAGARLTGEIGNVYGAAPLTGTMLKTVAAWAQGGAPQPAAIAATGAGVEIDHLALDLSALAGTVHGFHINGQNNGYVHDLAISSPPGSGVTDGGIGALTWRFRTVYVNGPGQNGWALTNGVSDSTFIDCSVIGGLAHGWYVFNNGNSKWIGCRAEFNAFTGMFIDGNVTAVGMGNVQVIGFSTDRNGLEGIRIGAQGNAPVLISGAVLRRDCYSNAAAPGNAALDYQSAKCPVLIDGLTVQPGVNDNGSGTFTPTAGINYTPAGAGASFLQVVNALLWVATGGTPLQGTTPDVLRAVTTVAAAVNTQPLTYTKIADNA